MPLPHIVPRRGWKSCNGLANHSNGVGVHSKKHILLPRGSIPCNNGSNNLTPSQFKQKSKISGSINHHTIKDSSMWKKIQKVKWNRIEVLLTHSWDPNHQNFVDHQIFFVAKFYLLFFNSSKPVLTEKLFVDCPTRIYFLSKE